MQGKCYINLRRYEEAKVIYEELLSEYPQSQKTENLRFRLAILALEDGLVEDGLKMLDSGWSSDSLRGEALFASGTVLSELGQHQDAVQKFLKASEFLSLDKKAEALFKAGEALEVIGENSGAYLHYRDALGVVVSEKLRKKIEDKIKRLHPELNYKEGDR